MTSPATRTETLDEAWRAVEAVLPADWTASLGVWPVGSGAFPDGEGPYEATATRYDDDFTGPLILGDGETPIRALQALRDKLVAG